MSQLKIIKAFLEKVGHQELIPKIDKLASIQALYDQIQKLQTLPEDHFLLSSLPPLQTPLTNPTIVELEGNPNDIDLGNQTINEGKVHALILAGGDGSRLKFDKPKALFPIYKSKSALHWFKKMVPEGCGLTLFCTEKGQKQIQHESIVIQPTLPLLDDKLEWRLDDAGTILSGPSGNGALFSALQSSHKLDEWEEQGIEHLVILNIDNLMLSPYDPNFIGIHIRNQSNLTLKGYIKTSDDKKVGSFSKHSNGLQIIDYQEDSDVSSLKYGNTNHMCFKMSVLRNINPCLPIHWVKKETKWQNQSLLVSKAEQFITDAPSIVNNSQLVVCDKSASFAPLKTLNDLPYIQKKLKNNPLIN